MGQHWMSLWMKYRCTLTGRQSVRFYMRVWRRRSAHSQFHTVSQISSFCHDSKPLPGESWRGWEIRHTPYSPDLMPATFLLLPNKRTTLKGWWLQDTESIRNSHHMKYISFEQLQWPCYANVRKIQKACCSQGRALCTKTFFFISRVSVPQTESWNFLSDQIMPNGMKGLEEAATTVFTVLSHLH